MKFFALSLAGIALAAVAGSAQAQDDTLTVQKPIRVMIGAFAPDSGSSRTSFGINYEFGKSKSTNPTIYGAYLDYNSKSSSSMTGFGIQGRQLLNSAYEGPKPYIGVGLGFYNIDPAGASSKTKVGGKIELGYELASGIFGALDYTYVQKVSGANPSGVNYRIGFRF